VRRREGVLKHMISKLSQREMEILTEVAQGKQNKEIACMLYISVHTVENHLKKIYIKLEVTNRIEASRVFWQTHNK
jgi:two-component system, NarL family, response regulator